MALDVRAVFVDLDDTFLAPDKSIPVANLALLDELERRGIELVPCTGRHPDGVPEALRTHPVARHIVASNGGIVRDVRAGEDIYVAEIPSERVASFYRQIEGERIAFDAFADGKAYSERARTYVYDEAQMTDGLRAYIRESRTFVDCTIPELLGEVGPVTKVSLWFADEAGAAAIDRAVAAAPDLYYVQTSASNYETMSTRATKGRALTWLAEHMGWPIEQTVAFGDNFNDVSMIEAAGVAVVMENGEEAVKAMTSHIAPPAAEGGVARYLLELLGE